MFDSTLCEVPKGYLQITLGDFNAEVGRGKCFKPIIGGHSLHQVSNDNGCRLIDLATGRNLRDQSPMFPHKKIHKGT